MNLLWPWFTLLLLIIPVILGIYIWILRRKRRYAVHYSSLSIIREAIPRRSRWRRHVPFLFFLLGVSCLIIAAARPVIEIEVPTSRTTIILALDISRSMCANDISPNRLTVAQDAATRFIENQVEGTQIGIVAFARLAEVIVQPTDDKEVLQEAIANLTTSFGTAIGSATLKSIDAIAEINPAVPPSGPEIYFTDQENPEYQPDIIVLLTDGANTHGQLPLDVAQQAADRQLRVYTIGFGTTRLTKMVCSREQLGSDFIRPGSIAFGASLSNIAQYLLLDEPTLQGVAEITGGTYYRAENADQLFEVFLNLPNQIMLQKENLEISVLFSTLGALFIFLAVMLSLLWNRFP